MTRQWDYGPEFEKIWGDLKDKRDGRKAAGYKIYLRTKKIMKEKYENQEGEKQDEKSRR
tara:strand:- start:305 stop:481 length:177 start_codon:yes stop_codon:yes gene_type:complete